MRVIHWQKPSRKFSDAEVDDFYNRQLRKPTLFRFRTKHAELPEHGGELSLKLILHGEEEYQIERRKVVLRPGQMLLINKGQHYSSRVLRETESVSIFFPARERSDLLNAALRSDPDYQAHVSLPQFSFTADQSSRVALSKLVNALDGNTEQDPHEASQQLMIEALRNLHQAAPFSKLKSASKPSTRNELIRRLVVAREQIDETDGRIVDLETLASTACLSKYYFLRLFTEMFGISPGAYARRVRLNKAVNDIRTGTRPQCAARSAGYDDYRAFRRACLRILRCDPA